MEPQQPQAPAPMPPMQPTQPTQPMQPAMAASNPGQGLGIASLVCSLVGISLPALILGIIGLKKSKEAGMSNGMALAGIIISSIGLVLGVLWFLLFIFGFASSTASTT